MTKRLYLDSSYIKQNEARVTAVKECETGYEVELDASVFFPSSGGQPNDLGTIGESNVLDVNEKGERVIHLVDKPLKVNDMVLTTLDWQRRFDHMCQHTGEHLLSFAASKLFDSANVGFHLGKDYSTADFDKPFSYADIIKLEEYTNELIMHNSPVSIYTVNESELENITLRKAAKGLKGDIRIISIEGADSCTCCGTHVDFTGEVGALKIMDSIHYKGGERVTFACGMRAVNHSRKAQTILDNLAKLFSCRDTEVEDALTKRLRELSASQSEAKALNNRICDYVKKELDEQAKTKGNIKIIVKKVELKPKYLRPLALKLTDTGKTIALLLCQSDDTLSYVLASSCGIPAKELIESANFALGGKGGGNDTLASGSAKSMKGLEESLAQLENYFLARAAQMKTK